MTEQDEQEEGDTDPAAPRAITPPPSRVPTNVARVDDLSRAMHKAVELVRLMLESGYDPEAELTRLHRQYERAQTGKVRIPSRVEPTR